MKNFLILFLALFWVSNTQAVFSQARTKTEYYSYSNQYTYDKATDGIIERNYQTYSERNKYNSEKFVCLFKNSTDETGYRYIVLTSGRIVKDIRTNHYNYYEFIPCHRIYDHYDNFNSKEELKAYAQKSAIENKLRARR